MTGLVDHWPAMQRWTPSYFRGLFKDQDVTATKSESGSYDRSVYETLKGSDYIDIMEGRVKRAEQIYLAGVSSHDFPALAGDFKHPPWVPKDVMLRIFLGHDTLTGSHFHPYHQTCLTQLYGQKKVTFHEPGQFKNLYPKPFLANSNNCSRVNFRKVDEQEFPRVLKTDSLEIVLNPGDMLYIPLHWWHTVLGLGPNISGAFHWGAPLSYRHFPQPGIRCALRVPFKRFPKLRKLVPKTLRES